MGLAYKIKPTDSKVDEMFNLVTGFWENDIWNLNHHLFDEYRNSIIDYTYRKINFTKFKGHVKLELKFFVLSRMSSRTLAFYTIKEYSKCFRRLALFFNKYYPTLKSIVDIPAEKAKIKFRTYLIESGLKTKEDGRLSNKNYGHFFNSFFKFYIEFYDTRDEFEKDTWDFRKIQGARFTENKSSYLLHFNNIPTHFKNIVKRYLKTRVITVGRRCCSVDVNITGLFFRFIHKKYPEWTNIEMLSRKDIEEYLLYYHEMRKISAKTKRNELNYLFRFLDYIQRFNFEEAPIKPISTLIFKEDLPRVPMKSEFSIKYIPDTVIQQLDDNLEHLTPSEYIPIVILLRNTGWRISDILNLKFDSCLDQTAQGWYLCGDIQKTQVMNHRVPITDEVAAMVKVVAKDTEYKSTEINNSQKLLFVRYQGKRMGRPPEAGQVNANLNKLARQRKIVDDQGNIFKFKSHAFRHTKAIELINNGMSLLHVQKWMAHASPEMTLQYAKILDETMRKSWEEVVEKGLFRIDEEGQVKSIDMSKLDDENVIEWEYIRYNLDAVRMPLGYCMKPKKQECHTQLNPCLTCRNLCTSPDFIPQFEMEIQETKAIVERGISQGRTVWAEKNQALLEKYINIIKVLKEGKIHHLAGKKGREYIGEEKHNAK